MYDLWSVHIFLSTRTSRTNYLPQRIPMILVYKSLFSENLCFRRASSFVNKV